MKKIIFLLLVLVLLITACGTTQTLDNEEKSSPADSGYIGNINEELEDSDLDNLDEDLNLGWI